jgi:hypothetical protein
MAAVAMVTKVQKNVKFKRTAGPFETWHKNKSSLKVLLFVFKIFKMAANIKIKKIVKNSKMNRFQWKWIFTGSKTCCTIWGPFWFAMVAILNQNGRQNTKILRFGRNLVSNMIESKTGL